jgi:hypothetical protein
MYACKQKKTGRLIPNSTKKSQPCALIERHAKAAYTLTLRSCAVVVMAVRRWGRGRRYNNERQAYTHEYAHTKHSKCKLAAVLPVITKKSRAPELHLKAYSAMRWPDMHRSARSPRMLLDKSTTSAGISFFEHNRSFAASVAHLAEHMFILGLHLYIRFSTITTRQQQKDRAKGRASISLCAPVALFMAKGSFHVNRKIKAGTLANTRMENG